MDYQIAESIMGHWFKGKSVNDRYGHIDDHELIQAIDSMSFDHGETVILAPNKAEKKTGPREKCEHFVNMDRPKRKKIQVMS